MYEPQSFRVMTLEEFLQSGHLENPEVVEEFLRQEAEMLRAENPTESPANVGRYEAPTSYNYFDMVSYPNAAMTSYPYDQETTDEYVERLHASDVPDRHPNSARFHELLRIAGETHDQKQTDYGKGDDPFANVRASEEWGIDGWVGAMVRLNDKVRRLQSLWSKGYLANESALDSFMDIAVYALIARVLYEQGVAEDASSR